MFPFLLPGWPGLCAAVLILLLTLKGASAALVINEFLPDPSGSDGGREYVEILNTGTEPVDLAGVSLEFANGIEGPQWTVRWRCEQTVFLASGARFLLVDRNWLGEEVGQAEAYLGLQNGPDAIRLAQEGQTLDLVGYGPLTDPLMMEGSPVPVRTGLALARRPDGRDTGDNGADFVSHAPTPGTPNFYPYQWELIHRWDDPPSLDRPGRPFTLTVRIRNAGLEDLGWTPVVLDAWNMRYEGILAGCPASAERELSWRLVPPEAGRWDLILRIPVPGAPDTLAVDLGQFQVGPSTLVLNEVLSIPEAGQGEWVELKGMGEEPVDLAAYRIRDEEGTWQGLAEQVLTAGQLAVVAQDTAALRDWLRGNTQTRGQGGCGWNAQEILLLDLPGSWPHLNNTPPEGRNFSDRVLLADASGTVVDQVTLPPTAWGTAGSGCSWERQSPYPVNPVASNWAPSTDQAGSTPGCDNSIAGAWPETAHFTIEPAVLALNRGADVLHLRFTVAQPAAGYWLQIYDTWGSLVRDLGGELGGVGPRDLLWDGSDEKRRPVGQGAYVAVLQMRTAGGQVLGRSQAVCAVVRP